MMKKKLLLRAALMLVVCGLLTAPAVGDIGLYDWAFNIDGLTYEYFEGDSAPGDVSGFDFGTGLGTITVEVTGAGAHYVGLFVDHEIDEADNTFFNENGAAVNTPAAGQSWEIDEPGYVFGDIYDNILAGSLDNTNAVPAGSENDVSMALGWDIEPGPGAIVTFVLSTTAPADGFYLCHSDPESLEADPPTTNPPYEVYMSSSVEIVPVPGAALMGVVGFGSIGWLGRRFKGLFAKK